MKKLISLILMFIICTASVCAMETEFKILPQYESCSGFVKGLAYVAKGGKSAVINDSGEIIVDFSKSYKRIRKNGLIMIVGEDDKVAFFNKIGEAVTEYEYSIEYISSHKNLPPEYYFNIENDGDGKSDLIPVLKEGKWGYINSFGREVIKPQFEYAKGFCGGVAIIGSVSENQQEKQIDRFGLINEKGEIIVPQNACTDITYYNSTMRMGYEDEVLYFLDFYDGEDKTYIGGKFYTDKNILSAGAKHIIKDFDKNPYVVYSDKTVIFPAGMYSKILLFGDNFIVDGCKIINKYGDLLYGISENEGIIDYSDQNDLFATVRIYENGNKFGKSTVGLASREGKEILPPVYDTAIDYGEGIIYARQGDKCYLFNYSGRKISDISFSVDGDFANGIAPCTDIETKKMGYIKNPLLYPKVFVKGERVISDVDAKIYTDRTLIPMRAIFEALGAEISWNDDEKKVTAKKGDDEITVTIGESRIIKNGEEIKIDTYARIEKSRTMIPLRAVSEALGCEVLWNDDERRIYIK